MIFVDTGAFLARHLKRDQHHEQAVSYWHQLRRERRQCFTSNFVLDETFTLLARRATYAFAAERARKILHSRALVIFRPTFEDEQAALESFQKYADQEISFTDRISFTLMDKHRLKDVFTDLLPHGNYPRYGRRKEFPHPNVYHLRKPVTPRAMHDL